MAWGKQGGDDSNLYGLSLTMLLKSIKFQGVELTLLFEFVNLVSLKPSNLFLYLFIIGLRDYY